MTHFTCSLSYCWPFALPTSPSSVAQALLDVSSTPDMRDVDELVVKAVAANWQRVALRLGVEGCVSEIVLRKHPNDCEGACRDMLNRWLRGERHTEEEERTWSTLLTALSRAGFVELERRLRREHFHKVIHSGGPKAASLEGNWPQPEPSQPEPSQLEPHLPQSPAYQPDTLSSTVYSEFML